MVSKIIFKVLLTLCSISSIATVYFISREYIFYFLGNYPSWLSNVLIIFLVLLLTLLSLLSKNFLSDGCIEKEPLNLEDATNHFLPTYLGYFFVGLSINNDNTFWWIFMILFAFVYCSQTVYFNPVLIICGYNFYNVITVSNKKIFLITKTKLIDVNDVPYLKLKAINNFTYIEK